MKALLLKPRHNFSRNELLSFIGVFAVIGGILLIRSFAFYDPTASVLYHAEGSLVQSAGDAKIYLVSGNQRHFVTLDDFRSGRFDLNKVVPATPGDEQLTLGPPVSLPTGILVEDQYTNSYYLTDKDSSGQVVRRPIDQAAMTALGYDQATALVATDLPPAAGSAVSTGSAHPTGTKLSLSRLGTYVVDNGQLRPASPEVLSSYKLTKAPTLPANQADLALPKGPALDYASGSLLQGSDPSKIYVVSTSGGTPLKRLISDSTVFMALGYDTNDIHKVADSQLPAGNGLPLPESGTAPITVSVNIKPGQDGTSLAKDFRSRSGTTIVSSYKDWVGLKLPFKDLAGLKADPRVASVIGSAQSNPSYTNCNDTGVGVAVPCPIIDSFTASPSSIAYGASSTLSWTSEYSNNCSINGGGVPTTGSQSTGALTATAGYTLTCNTAQTSSGVYSVSAGAGVTVAAPPSGGGGGTPGPNYSSTCDAFNVTLRDNINYAGNCLSTSTSQPDLSQITRPGGNWNNAARSIDVKAGLGTTVSLYSATNYGGSCAQYTVDDSDLSTPSTGPTFNLMAASMKVGSACPSTAPPPPTSGGCSGTTLANNTPPVITGSATVGSTLSSSQGTWCGTPQYYHYYWSDCTDGGPDNRVCKNIANVLPSATSYTIQSSDAGYQIRVQVDVSSTVFANSNWTAVVPGAPAPPPPSPPANISPPTITGTLQVGSTLNGSSGNWTNSPTSYSYLWMRCNPDVATGSQTCTNISGATARSYTLQTADANSVMKLKVTASNASGTPVAATSNPTGVIQAASGGTGGTGSSCDGTSGVYLYSAINYSGTCAKVPASTATATSLAIGNDTASSIKFVGSWTADLYQDANYGGNYSEFTMNHPDLGQYDINNSTMSSIRISSGATDASSKTCTNQSAPTLPGVYLYSQTGWLGKCDYFTGTSLRDENWNIADNQTRSVRIVGNFQAALYGQVKLGNPIYTTTSDVSDLTNSPVKPGTASGVSSIGAVQIGGTPPSNIGLPQITGTPTVGYTLKVSTGSWTNGPITSYQYEWERCSGPASQPYCNAISGQTTNSYKVVSGDVNYNIRATVWATNSSGTSFASSQITATVTGPTPPPSTLNGLAWPFATKSPSQYNRIDQGWDIQSSAGAAIYAVAPGTVNTYLANCGAFGPDSPVEQLDTPFTEANTSGWIYYGHAHIITSLKGRHVTTGQLIGYTNKVNNQSNSYGCVSGAQAGWLEIGFSQPASNAPIQKSSNEAWTAAGQKMHDLLIGAPTAAVASATQSAGLDITTDPAFDTSFKPDTLASISPGLAAIGWTPGSVKGTVAVVGTGVDPVSGLDVRYNYAGSVPDCSYANDNLDGSADKHDTMVARIIGQTGDGLNTPAGVAPGATIVSIRATGENNEVPTTLGIACGIRWAADHGIKVINVSSAAAVSAFANPKPDFNNCLSPNAEAELSAICYASSKGASVITAAGNYAADANAYVPARYDQALTISSANEFNGLPPNNPNDLTTAPLNSDQFIVNSFSGFCGTDNDSFGQSDSNYNGGKPNFYAAPLCIWMGGPMDEPSSYPHGTSFSAAMASGVLLRSNLNKANLAKGGAAGKTNGHSYGYELHL